jgi:hypothetical protein
LSLIPYPLLKMTLAGFLVLFSCKYIKYIDHIPPPTTIHLPLPPTTNHHLTGPVLRSCPSLFKHIFIVQWGFAMVLHL